MYIHRILSGSKKQFLKLLLRECYRNGRRIKQRTLANLSGWSFVEIAALESALKVRRTNPPGSAETVAAEHRIYTLVSNRLFKTRPAATYQILSALKRPHGSDVITGGKPLRTRKAKRQSSTAKATAWSRASLPQAVGDDYEPLMPIPMTVQSTSALH